MDSSMPLLNLNMYQIEKVGQSNFISASCRWEGINYWYHVTAIWNSISWSNHCIYTSENFTIISCIRNISILNWSASKIRTHRLGPLHQVAAEAGLSHKKGKGHQGYFCSCGFSIDQVFCSYQCDQTNPDVESSLFEQVQWLCKMLLAFSNSLESCK